MTKPARGPVLAFLNIVGSDGVTLPPLGIYIRERCLADDRLCRHEQTHWAQWQKMGTIRFYATYLWYNVRYGYQDNPMEVEARKSENPT